MPVEIQFAIAIVVLVLLFVAIVVAWLLFSKSRPPQTASALVPVRGQMVSRVASIVAARARDQALPGEEWFSPEPLAKNEEYLVTISGTVGYKTRYGRYDADALYLSDYGNYTGQHDCLEFDLRPVVREEANVVHEDRDLHRYVIAWTGSGEKLAVLFRPHACRLRFEGSCRESVDGSELKGSLRVQIEPAPKPRPLPAPSHKERAVRLRELSESLRNWADLKFRRDYAKRKGAELLQKQDQVVEEYRKLLQDPELLAWIKKNDPELAGRLTGRLETLLLAERLEVAEPRARRVRRKSDDKSNEASRPKLTPEEYRDRLVRRLRVKSEDKAALLQASIEGQLNLRDKAREIVDKKVSDPDEKERWYEEIDRVLGEEEDGDEGIGAKAERY